MNARYEYSRSNRENLPLSIQIKVSKNHRRFAAFFFAFLVSTWNFQWAGKKISLIAQVFLKLLTPKDVLITMDNSASFWKPFRSEHVNESQKLLNSAEKYLYPTTSLFRGKLSYKELLLMRSEFLGLLLNTLTANCEYSRSNRENLPLPIQIKSSKKSSTFCSISFCIRGIYIKFQCWEKRWTS